MSRKDHWGCEHSTGSAASVEAYEGAVGLFNRYRGDPVAAIDAALAEDPDYAGGHILRAEIHMSMWEASVQPEVEAGRDRLAALGNRLNGREAAHAEAIRLWADGDWDGARGALERLSADHPRDMLALQIGHLCDFFHGDRDNIRGRVLRAKADWTPDMPGYGFVLGMSAFGHEECGAYGKAEEAGRHALYHLDRGHPDEALRLYDAAIRPGDSRIQLEMLDATALLWRMHLMGVEAGYRWPKLADAYAGEADYGFYVFNDMHATMAFTAAGRTADADRVVAAATAAANRTGTNARMARAVGVPIVQAIRDFGAGRYDRAVDLLMPVRHRAHAFGGSNAQRDIVHRTLIEASLRAGNRGLAHALTEERVALKPHCPFSWGLKERADALH